MDVWARCGLTLCWDRMVMSSWLICHQMSVFCLWSFPRCILKIRPMMTAPRTVIRRVIMRIRTATPGGQRHVLTQACLHPEENALTPAWLSEAAQVYVQVWTTEATQTCLLQKSFSDLSSGSHGHCLPLYRNFHCGEKWWLLIPHHHLLLNMYCELSVKLFSVMNHLIPKLGSWSPGNTSFLQMLSASSEIKLLKLRSQESGFPKAEVLNRGGRWYYLPREYLAISEGILHCYN